MALTVTRIVNLPEGAKVTVSGVEKVAPADGGVLFDLAEGAYTAVIDYGGQLYNIDLNVGKSVADQVFDQISALGLHDQQYTDDAVALAIQGLHDQQYTDDAVALAIQGLHDQAYTDEAVATALQGMKTEAEVVLEIENAMAESQGYLNFISLDTGTDTAVFSVSDTVTPLAYKYQLYTTSDMGQPLIGSILTLPTDRVITIENFSKANTIKILRANEKVLDTIDLNFSVVVPVPAPSTAMLYTVGPLNLIGDTLTLIGLAPDTTYIYRVQSLTIHSDVNSTIDKNVVSDGEGELRITDAKQDIHLDTTNERAKARVQVIDSVTNQIMWQYKMTVM